MKAVAKFLAQNFCLHGLGGRGSRRGRVPEIRLELTISVLIKAYAELHRVVASLDIAFDSPHQLVFGPIGGAARGIGRQRLMAAPAEKLIHRHLEGLALEIEQSHFDPAQDDRAQTDPAPELAAVKHALIEDIYL